MQTLNKEIIEGSKLIAVFMGAFEGDKIGNIERNIYFEKPMDNLFCYNETGLKYHSSWEWIMPACEKWDKLEGFMIGDQSDKYEELSDSLDNSVTRNYEIDDVFNQLVLNIKWYNKNKSSNK